MKKVISLLLCFVLTFSLFIGCSKQKTDPLPFTGTDYSIPELDLSVMPENCPEEYRYLYEISTVDNSLDYVAHPDSVLLKNGKNAEAAKAFLEFLKGPEAAKIKQAYGYGAG